MDLPRLIEALSDPAAYPHPVDAVAIRQTHISVVFLAGPFVYKVKKPVRFDFLDFSALEKRHHFCGEEVRLNRRLAPDVYLGVVPITEGADGVTVEGTGPVVEWAVKMRRLPEEATLHERVLRGEVDARLAEELARRIAAFHQSAPAAPERERFGRFEAVARNLLDVFTQAGPHVGSTVSRGVFDRLRALMEADLNRLRPLIDARAGHGQTRDTHGDLHLDHVYHFPDRPPPADLVIVDGIEFNERFRFIDPVSDMAFLVMDLAYHGRRDLADVFAEVYFRAAGDDEGRALLPLYTAYRATVRGLVEGLRRSEREVPESERQPALQSARAHWLLALAELEEPRRRPCLVLVAGLPGTGKSTLARGLAGAAGFTVVRSDEVRKELAGLRPTEPTPEAMRQQLYSPEGNDRTYAECLRRAEALLWEGARVIVDANFREEQRRRLFLEVAVRWGVPAALLLCRGDPEAVRRRLEDRRGDASDADWSVYQLAASRWEEPSPSTRQSIREVFTEGDPEEALRQALEALRGLRLS